MRRIDPAQLQHSHDQLKKQEKAKDEKNFQAKGSVSFGFLHGWRRQPVDFPLRHGLRRRFFSVWLERFLFVRHMLGFFERRRERFAPPSKAPPEAMKNASAGLACQWFGGWLEQSGVGMYSLFAWQSHAALGMVSNPFTGIKAFSLNTVATNALRECIRGKALGRAGLDGRLSFIP